MNTNNRTNMIIAFLLFFMMLLGIIAAVCLVIWMYNFANGVHTLEFLVQPGPFGVRSLIDWAIILLLAGFPAAFLGFLSILGGKGKLSRWLYLVPAYNLAAIAGWLSQTSIEVLIGSVVVATILNLISFIGCLAYLNARQPSK